MLKVRGEPQVFAAVAVILVGIMDIECFSVVRWVILRVDCFVEDDGS